MPEDAQMFLWLLEFVSLIPYDQQMTSFEMADGISESLRHFQWSDYGWL